MFGKKVQRWERKEKDKRRTLRNSAGCTDRGRGAGNGGGLRAKTIGRERGMRGGERGAL